MSDAKVQVTPAQPGEHPKAAAERIGDELAAARDDVAKAVDDAVDKAQGKDNKQKAKDELKKAENKSIELWEKTKQVVLQPGVAGGILGFVNIAVFGTLGYKLYTEPGLRTDRRFLTTSSIAAVALLTGEGAIAEAYRKTDAGKREEAKAREEGAALYKQAKTIILRPGVLGGIVGVVNVGILGGVGYWSYVNWDTTWDRRAVSATTVGLLALFAGEGYLGEQYLEKKK